MTRKILIFTGILLSILIIFNYVVMPYYVKHSELAKVPNVVGKTFDEAKKIIEDAGLTVKQGELKFDETKPVGIILDQNPPPEQIVKASRRIYITLNGGEQLVEVPKLSGRTLRDARFTLEQRNLKIGEVVKKFSNQFPEDVVISQVMQPGSKVKRLATIDVIVSNGPQIGNIIIPDLVGKKLEEAKKIIVEKKLKVGKITYQPSDQPPGTIVDQYPKKDKSAKENTEVQLIVTKKRVVEVQPEDFDSETETGNVKPDSKGGDGKAPETKTKTEKPEPKEKKNPEQKPKNDPKAPDKPKELKPKTKEKNTQ